jgi:hypothetical protein
MKDAAGALLIVAQRCATGESLCRKCGKALDSYLELERGKAMKLLAADRQFKNGFDLSSSIVALPPEQNPFPMRSVYNNMSVGLEVPLPVFCVEVEALEKKFSMSAEIMNLKYETLYNPRGDRALRVIVLDQTDPVPADIPVIEGKMYFRKESQLSECVLRPQDQLRAEQALNTWAWQAARNEDEMPQFKHAHAQGSGGGSLKWSHIQGKVDAAQAESKKREESLSAGVDRNAPQDRGPQVVQIFGAGNIRDMPLLGGVATRKGKGGRRGGTFAGAAASSSSAAVPKARTAGTRGRGQRSRNTVAAPVGQESVVACSSSDGDDAGSRASGATVVASPGGVGKKNYYAYKHVDLTLLFKGGKAGAITVPARRNRLSRLTMICGPRRYRQRR